jgi:two-component sensor histidine kinase
METYKLKARLTPYQTPVLFAGSPSSDEDYWDTLAGAITDTLHEPLLILDAGLQVVMASRSFYLAFGMRPQDVQGHRLYALANGEWNFPELHLLLEKVAEQHALMEACEVERGFSGIGRRSLVLNARKVFNETTSRAIVLLAIEDVTERREREREQKHYAIMETELQALLERQEALRHEMHEVAQRQIALTTEFEHRLVNGLQIISSLLSLQSRRAADPEASAQLTTAANRVAALGRVHRRLHLLDNQVKVRFKQYLQLLCDDLSGLLCEPAGDCNILVSGGDAEIATDRAIPLGFIVNELITNSVKYTKGNIRVRFESNALGHSLSVEDDGDGLPAEFEPTQSRGLGMKIVLSQVKQIGGELQIQRGGNGRGTRFVVMFPSA